MSPAQRARYAGIANVRSMPEETKLRLTVSQACRGPPARWWKASSEPLATAQACSRPRTSVMSASGSDLMGAHTSAPALRSNVSCRGRCPCRIGQKSSAAWERRQLISKQLFTEHFWWVYNRLQSRADGDYTTAAYFRFMTLLGAFGHAQRFPGAVTYADTALGQVLRWLTIYACVYAESCM